MDILIAIYPGSFDPVTYGHIDIIRRVSLNADRLIVGVAVNINKTPFFDFAERIDFLEKMTTDLSNVEIKSFSGLLIDFASDNKADVIIRGLRSGEISEYEYQMAVANTKYASKENTYIDTYFILSKPELIHVSSTLVKEIVICGGNAEDMVPGFIADAIRRKIKK